MLQRQVLLPISPPGGFTVRDLPRLMDVVDAGFELLDGTGPRRRNLFRASVRRAQHPGGMRLPANFVALDVDA